LGSNQNGTDDNENEGNNGINNIFAPWHLWSDLLGTEWIYFQKPNATKGRVTFEELRKYMHVFESESGEKRRLTISNAINIFFKRIFN
jgi:hypothetical protein